MTCLNAAQDNCGSHVLQDCFKGKVSLIRTFFQGLY
jgi:hypothetical protein